MLFYSLYFLIVSPFERMTHNHLNSSTSGAIAPIDSIMVKIDSLARTLENIDGVVSGLGEAVASLSEKFERFVEANNSGANSTISQGKVLYECWDLCD